MHHNLRRLLRGGWGGGVGDAPLCIVCSYCEWRRRQGRRKKKGGEDGAVEQSESEREREREREREVTPE